MGTAVRPAASVILVRPDGRVLWVRRGEQLRFAGGFYAFPGGRVDESDAAVPLLHLPPGGEGPVVAAAARELFEETGVLALGRPVQLPEAERRALREALLRRPAPGERAASFADFLRSRGLAVDARLYQPAGRWVTPPYMPVRFDARFFVVALPDGEEADIWPGELADGEWLRPEDALRRWEEGTALLHPPAWHSLKALAHYEDPLPALRDPSLAPWRLPIRDHVVEQIEFQRGLLLVPLRTPTLPPATHTNCFLLGDDELWLVDPGSPWPEEQAFLRRALDELARQGRKAAGVLLTHHHHDHIGGAEVLREQLGLPIAASAATQELLPFGVDRVLRDGDVLEAGPRGWRAMHLPGHTRGHVCLVENGSGAVIAGDLVAGVGTVIIDPPEGDMTDYLASLDRLLAQKPGALFPAHGQVLAAGAAKLEEYVRHRHAREKLVLESLRAASRPSTPAELVPNAYPELKAELYPLAERSLLAHLYKLKREGRAREERGLWS